jgi:hypothetical protein
MLINIYYNNYLKNRWANVSLSNTLMNLSELKVKERCFVQQAARPGEGVGSDPTSQHQQIPTVSSHPYLSTIRSLIQRSAALSKSNAFNNRPDQVERRGFASGGGKEAFAVKRNAKHEDDPESQGMIKDYMTGVFDKS